MKIYAILLRHSMFSRGGWRETERALSQAYDSQVYQKSFSQTVLSHTVSEISFTMKSTYRDLLKLAKSKNQQETHKAMDRMENILSFLISAAQFVLDDEICVTKGIPHWIVGKLRVRCHNQLIEEKNGQIEVGTNKWSDEIDVEDYKNRLLEELKFAKKKHVLSETSNNLSMQVDLIKEQNQKIEDLKQKNQSFQNKSVNQNRSIKVIFKGELIRTSKFI
jgi:hypothetical protein